VSEIVRGWRTLPAALACEFIFCAPETPTLASTTPLQVDVRVAPGRSIWWEQIVLPRLAQEAGAHVLFAPGYSGPVTSSVPLVVAIHDVSFAAHPEWFGFSEGLRRRSLTRASARKAARILTISEFSRREIVDFLGVPPSKVALIYPGAPVVRLTPASPPTGEALLLYVGSLFNRRHIPELIEGFGRLAVRHSGARLTLVGENRTFPHLDIGSCIARAKAAQRIELQTYVPDAMLDELYARATACVFLSEYEGFGLTPLEALAHGVPIVVLDTPVAREVYGDAAIYVSRPEPRLVEAALDAALYDQETRRILLGHAPSVVARYSWQDCAARVLDVLVSAAG
jgi:glycosyltransferase involved in cell wall biosynthesis